VNATQLSFIRQVYACRDHLDQDLLPDIVNFKNMADKTPSRKLSVDENKQLNKLQKMATCSYICSSEE